MSVKPASPEKSAFNIVLEQGGKHNVRNMICDFAGQRELLHVSKAFRRTNQNTMVDVGRTLSMSRPEQVRKIEDLRQKEIPNDERPAAEILPGLFQEVNDLMGALHPRVGPERGNRLEDYRDRLAEIRDRWLQEEDGNAKETHISHLLIALQRSKPLLAEMRNRLDAAEPVVNEEVSPWGRLSMLFNAYIAQENISKRFQEVSAERNPQDAAEIFSCLSLLRENQRAAMTREIRADFSRYEEAHPGSFSPAYFAVAENHVFHAGFANEQALIHLWHDLQPIVNAGPARNSSPTVIRRWITDEANAGALGQVHHLWVRGASHIPHEIDRLHNLEFLSYEGNDNGRLTELPEEIANLRNLSELELNDNNFPEIPRVLERIPALQGVWMRRNAHPIHVFPQWLDAHINRGFWGGFNLTVENEFRKLVRLDKFLGLRILPLDQAHDIRLFSRQYAGLPDQQLTDVPFGCWFRETFSIPNFTLYFTLGLMEFVSRLGNIRDLYQQGWLEMTRALLLPLIPATAWFGLLIGGVMWAPVPLLLAILICIEISNLSFIPNAILLHVIEPFVEEIREELGYDPMVHIRDIPEAPEVAQVAAQV